MLLHAHTTLQCCSKCTMLSSNAAKISSDRTTKKISTPALKEHGKGWMWFSLFYQESENEVYMTLTCVMVPLDHHHHHNVHRQWVPPFHLHVYPWWIKLPSLGIQDESMAQVQGPVANHKWKWKEVSPGAWHRKHHQQTGQLQGLHGMGQQGWSGL